MAHGVGSLLRQWLIQAAILIITGVRRSAPLSDERLVVVQQFDVDGPEGGRYEICDAAIAVHHQAQGRGLHAADWQYALVARLAPQQCEKTAHVHADQPVCAGPAQCRVIQAEGVGAGLERCQRLANGGVIQRRQPQTLNRSAIAAVLDQFAGDHFAFTISVGGDHQFFRLAQQPLDSLELAGRSGFYQHLPLLGHDGQVFQHPALVARIVGIGRGCFEQMANAPGDGSTGTDPAAIATAGCAKRSRNVLGLGRFFAKKQPHDYRRRLPV